MTDRENAPLVAFRDIVKRFGGVTAVKGVTLEVRSGEILALLGENGAGKSTLIKTLAGIHDPDEGGIYYRGAPYRHRPAKFGQRQPVAFIHQDLGLVDWMTIAENIALAIGYPRKGPLIDWRAAEAATHAALAQLNCPLDPTMRVHDLTRTEKSLVAIARALAVESSVLVLDEPSAALPADEVHRLFDAVRLLKARGVGMIYVSHRLDEVFEIADRVAVLRDGVLVGERDVAETTPDELVSLIVGKALERFEGSVRAAGLPTRLEAKALAVEGAGPVDIAVTKSEIIGLVGLRGAGHERIGRALFGSFAHKGEIWLDGEKLELVNAAAAMAAGIGLIARDRIDESTAAGLSIRENAFINPAAIGRSIVSLLSPRKEARNAFQIGARVGLRPNAPDLPIEALSGGNQQKVVVGRWLAIGGKVLIAEDPTAGVDVGAKAEIYRLLDEALKTGLCVVVVSTDFEEVARLCHRALVFSRGQIVAELSGQGNHHRAPDTRRLRIDARGLREDDLASSIKSTALEPTRYELANATLFERVRRFAPVYGLVILAVLLGILFSLLLPETFPTMINLRSIIGDKAIIAILSLAVMIPMVTGKIDLTVGYGIVLWHILAISLQTKYGFSWPLAVFCVLALGGLIGFLNGVLVEIAQIDAFIATLGTGTVLYAIAMWHTQGHQVVGVAPDGFYAIAGAFFLDLPITGYYVLALTLALWIILEYLPIGRYFYAIGANPKAAALNGIPVRRYTIAAFVSSGLLTAFAGILLASRLRIGQASVGLEYLLPALVGAFLGSTTIKPGRVNVWGTIVGVAILAIGISGIQQFGASFFVEPLFNGATLLVAIGIAGYAQRRRGIGALRAPASLAQASGNSNEPAATPKGE